MRRTVDGRAIVLGASMTGLLAARALADRYAEVTVVDRDELPVGSLPRRGVPQGRHAHAVLAGGLRALTELFPGIVDEMVAHGAPVGDVLGDTQWHLSGHRLRQGKSGLTVVSVSRAFLEDHVRARVRATPGVTVIDRCDIVGLAATPDRRRITGARLLRRADGSAEELLGADLVVDATGRGSRAGVWLADLGFSPAEEDRVTIGLGYVTRTFRLRPGGLGGDLGILYGPSPDHPRGGALARLEGDRWMLTLCGILGDRPPTDPDGFLAFARSLPDIYDAVVDAEPLDDPVAFHFPASVRRRYERLSRLPAGFLMMGDSVCSFNPVYGQGMTVAALQALALRRHLKRHAVPPARPFLRDIARVVDVAWDMVVGGDLALPGVDGHRTRRHRMVGAYVARLHAAAAHDAALGSSFLRVAGLVDRPESLLHPRVALRVLRRTWF